MVSLNLSSTIVGRRIPLYFDGVVSGYHHSGNGRSRWHYKVRS